MFRTCPDCRSAPPRPSERQRAAGRTIAARAEGWAGDQHVGVIGIGHREQLGDRLILVLDEVAIPADERSYNRRRLADMLGQRDARADRPVAMARPRVRLVLAANACE